EFLLLSIFFFSSRRRHTRWPRDWSSDVCSSDLSPGECMNVQEVLSQYWLEDTNASRPEVGWDSWRRPHRETLPMAVACVKARSEIGRASCRKRVQISVVAVSLKNKK